MVMSSTAVRVDGVGPPAGPAHLRVWRPFPRKRLDVVCEDISNPRVGLHVHEQLQITLPITRVHIVDGVGGTELIEAGAVGFTNPAELHSIVPGAVAACRARVLLVAAETVVALYQTFDSAHQRCEPWFPARVAAGDPLAAELHELFDELQRPLIAPACERRLVDCLTRLIMRYAAPRRPVEDGSPRRIAGVRDVSEYLQAHISKPVSIDRLADVAGLSKYYLLRSFVRHYGVSPHAYQMQLRLARACTLLTHGVSPTYAAYAAGFADQSHLTRRMRAVLGFTPGAYARVFSAKDRGAARAVTAPALLAGIDTAAA